MKKKIAVFANGLNSENFMKFMKGINETSENNFADFHVFLSHDSFVDDVETSTAECCIYSLPNLKEYDGAIIFGPGLNNEKATNSLYKKCLSAGIPTISISNKFEGTIRIYTDNYEGMKLIAEHLIDEHNIHDAIFIAGPEDNFESNQRLLAVKDTFESRNLPFNEDNVLFSDWVAYKATDFVKNRHLSDAGLPDAIICANDNLAYFVCFILDDLGVKCPEAVIVTGFDGDLQAMNMYPSITTVEQPFYEMGTKTVECFHNIFAGEIVEEEYKIPCNFRKAESCGCDISEKYDQYRRQFSTKTFKNSIKNDLDLTQMKALSDVVLKSESYSTIGHYLQEFFYNSNGVEGNPFYICMDPDFAKLSEADVYSLPQYRFTTYFYMLVGKNGDNRYDTYKYDISDGLIPFESADEINHIYVFLPIYHKSFVCGYIIMADNIEYFSSRKYLFFHSQFNRLLDQYKKNMQLTSLNTKLSFLMNTDVLTSTKNRMAFEYYKRELIEDIKNKKITEIAIVAADINNLKYINDTFGHEFGDKYIKNSSRFICQIFKHSPVFRIGGDEFVVVLLDEDYAQRDDLSAAMSNMMDDLSKQDIDSVEKISIAFGIADYDYRVDKTLDDTIKRADNLMYKNKRRCHGDGPNATPTQ